MNPVTAQRMRDIDRIAISRYKIPSLILMENAGIAVTEEVRSALGSSASTSPIAIICGKGNNGGDGFVIARHAHLSRIPVVIILMSPEADIKKGDALTNYTIAKRLGIKIVQVRTQKEVKRIGRRFSYDAVVDAMFGTGFSGALPVHIRHMVNMVNGSGIPVYAVDVPSGLDATTGIVHDACMEAKTTITIGLPKTGFYKNDGPRVSGRIVTRTASFPLKLLA